MLNSLDGFPIYMDIGKNNRSVCKEELFPTIYNNLKKLIEKNVHAIHTKRKVVKKSSNVLSTGQLYGCQPKSCQSRQHWQPKSSHHDNPNLGECQNRHRQNDNLTELIVVSVITFWRPYDNFAFCVLFTWILLIHTKYWGSSGVVNFTRWGSQCDHIGPS